MLHCLFVVPCEEVDELSPVFHSRLPCGDDVEPVVLHDPRCVVAEAVVERFLVPVEDLVDPELVNHC